MFAIAAFLRLILALSQLVAAQYPPAGPFFQCGGQGWTGPTLCVSGYTCTYVNQYDSQCQPIPTCTLAPAKTLVPGNMWQRVPQESFYHYYVQSLKPNAPGPVVVSSYTTAGQGSVNAFSGQWTQSTPCGTTLYATLIPPVQNTNRMQVIWQTVPSTNVSWGYGVTGYGDTGVVVTSITGGQQYQPQGNGNFLLCLSAAGGDGTNDAPWLYYNLNAYGVNSPWACYDATIEAFNGQNAEP